jgi:hypothetical protein
MKFEIINPSDEAYIEGEFRPCCMATLLFGEGKYALDQVDGDLKLPLFIFGGSDDWCQMQFGYNLQDTFDKTPAIDIANALLSVKLAGERSSMNDFTAYANKLGKRMLENLKAKETAP